MASFSDAKAVSWRLWRHRLFPTWPQGMVSLGLLAILIYALSQFLPWALWNASFLGTKPEDCTGTGACWVFISVRFKQFLVGFYPDSELWRPITVGVLSIVTILSVAKLAQRSLVTGILLGLALIAVDGVLLYGGFAGLEPVETRLWGGLMLTLLISSVGILGSLPMGIALALGRQSEWPLIRWLSTGLIEFWRGVPLVSVLFMSSVMLPLFLPEGVAFDKLLRAMIGVVLFAGAYMAEVIRGGLQALPKGQLEAAQSLGMSAWDSMHRIVLPQALRLALPGIINVFIALIKDTSLVLIIGMFDLLGMVKAALSDPQWQNLQFEGYVFAGFVFWIICFSFSRFGLRLERRQNRSRA